MEGLKEIVLHKPLSPYVSSAYTTLISVVEGVALGALFYTASTITNMDKGWSIPYVCKSFVVLTLIAFMWHRYVVHNQFTIWRLYFLDTVIPIFFAALQFGLALAVLQSTEIFSFILFLISFLGIFAYWHAVQKYKKPQTLQLYKEHFTRESEQFSINLHNAVNEFQKIYDANGYNSNNNADSNFNKLFRRLI